jgi:hypothetical protein
MRVRGVGCVWGGGRCGRSRSSTSRTAPTACRPPRPAGEESRPAEAHGEHGAEPDCLSCFLSSKARANTGRAAQLAQVAGLAAVRKPKKRLKWAGLDEEGTEEGDGSAEDSG